MSQICSYFNADVFIITYKYSYINTFRKMTQGSEVKWGGGVRIWSSLDPFLQTDPN